MAPLKQLNKQISLSNMDRGIKTRSQQVLMKKDVLPKRKADESPLKRITVKRSALGDVGNHISSKENDRAELDGKAIIKQAAIISREIKTRSSSKTRKPLSSVNSIKPPIPPAAKAQVKDVQKAETSKPRVTIKDLKTELATIAVTKPAVIVKTTATVGILPRPTKTQVKIIKKQPEVPVVLNKKQPEVPVLLNKKQPEVPVVPPNKKQPEVPAPPKVPVKSRKSDIDKSESSLYVSALEELNLDDGVKDKSGKSTVKKKSRRPPPPGIEDFDKENINEPNSVAIYAMDIFDYLKTRENTFKIKDYMCRQPDLNVSMRALVVNWMVEVQENFELNHETLYLGVKLVDLYLSKVRITKNKLQLIACASLFVAAKYDERFPPIIDDMLYVCDGLYSSEDLTGMEVELLKAVDFQLGIPLSYRFLRRYARCNKVQLRTLTLARYILETSLLDYSIIRYSDSKLASAALHLALIMEGEKEWTSTLEYYSGYKIQDFKDIMKVLNEVLHKRHTKEHAIKIKYSHNQVGIPSTSREPLCDRTPEEFEKDFTTGCR